ncbi:hypothetical protein ACEPAI_5675 [Sanghuangporus weigelae]
MVGLPSTLSGFAVLPVVYSKDATHILYAKQHTAVKKPTSKDVPDVLPSDRTLFLVNVPPDTTERELTLFFKADGMVEKVVFDQRAAEEEALNALEESDDDDDDDEGQDKDESIEVDEGRPAKKPKKSKIKDERPTLIPLPSTPLRTFRQTGRTAFVVFLDASSLTKALTPPHKPRLWPNSPEPRGLALYKALYSAMRPPLDAIRAHAESAIAVYDYEEAKRKRSSEYRKGEAIVDEDGFTLVTRGGAYGKTLGGGVSVATKQFQETGETATKKKKRKAEKEGFYAFQKHEKKRQELIELKRKWKEDLEKVEKLKEAKRYKPY